MQRYINYPLHSWIFIKIDGNQHCSTEQYTDNYSSEFLNTVLNFVIIFIINKKLKNIIIFKKMYMTLSYRVNCKIIYIFNKKKP